METKEMSRMEIYFELAKYVHQDHYKQIITWKTEHLKRLLDWHTRKENLVIPRYDDFVNFLKGHGVRIGVDFAREGEEHSVIFSYPFGFKLN